MGDDFVRTFEAIEQVLAEEREALERLDVEAVEVAAARKVELTRQLGAVISQAGMAIAPAHRERLGRIRQLVNVNETLAMTQRNTIAQALASVGAGPEH